MQDGHIITPVILAGGSGSRLWPLSRKSYPKQFSNLVGKGSLFQQTAHRTVSSEYIKFENHITITNTDFRFIVCEQLQEINIDPGLILIEPEGKNTAPAIIAASICAIKNNPESILLIVPSDHVISDLKAFHSAIVSGLEQVDLGKIVTFGIKPTRPETGYGYLELLNPSKGEAMKLKRFVEKPNKNEAKVFFEDKTYLWNAGIFMFRAKDMLKAVDKYAPNLFLPVNESIKNGKEDLDFFRLDPNSWSGCEDISIDYAIMEHADNLVTIPLNSYWSDLGDWDSVWKEQVPDENGVVTSKNAMAIDCKDTLLRSEDETQHIVGLGLDGIIAIATPDAVLVANKDKSQEIKDVVLALKDNNIPQADIFPKAHRPWGFYEILVITKKFQVKRIMVKPGGKLSLQSHKYRSEHWVIVEGSAKVTLNKIVKYCVEGESVFIPVGTIHRIENPSKSPLFFIEVQTGTYFGEDDIIRYDDIYARK